MIPFVYEYLYINVVYVSRSEFIYHRTRSKEILPTITHQWRSRGSINDRARRGGGGGGGGGVISYPEPNVRNDDRLQYDITYRGT